MSLDNFDRGTKEIKLFPQTILQVPEKRKMQAWLSTGSKDDYDRRADANLSNVLHV